MSNFGALTDHFGLASANLVLVDSSEERVAQSRADAQDENGDIAASAYYGNSTQNMREISCTYTLRSGTLNINTIKLGALAGSATTIRESVDVTTSNDGMPQITVSGRKNAIAPVAPSGKANTFSLPSISLSGAYRAQPLSFTVGSGCRLTGSNLSASVEIQQAENGLGEPVAHGLSGGTGTISAELVRITTAPSVTFSTGAPNAAFGITLVKAAGESQGQAAFHTATAEAQFTITRDNA